MDTHPPGYSVESARNATKIRQFTTLAKNSIFSYAVISCCIVLGYLTYQSYEIDAQQAANAAYHYERAQYAARRANEAYENEKMIYEFRERLATETRNRETAEARAQQAVKAQSKLQQEVDILSEQITSLRSTIDRAEARLSAQLIERAKELNDAMQTIQRLQRELEDAYSARTRAPTTRQ